jgi:hypothetical protein
MSEANAIYGGLKLYGEIKSPATALAAVSSAVKKSDNRNSGGRKGDWKWYKKCNKKKKHSEVCWRENAKNAPQYWKNKFGEFVDGMQIKLATKRKRKVRKEK